MKRIMALSVLVVTLSGCFSTHFHYAQHEVLSPEGIAVLPSSRFEDWSYAADTVRMKNVILESIAGNIDKRCFSHIVVDSILHSLGNPKSTVVFRRSSMREYDERKGLFFVEIPKLKKLKDHFRPTEYRHYIEVPVIFVDDSCWFINNGTVEPDSIHLQDIRQQISTEFDSTYVETMINRYREGRKSKVAKRYKCPHYLTM